MLFIHLNSQTHVPSIGLVFTLKLSFLSMVVAPTVPEVSDVAEAALVDDKNV